MDKLRLNPSIHLPPNLRARIYQEKWFKVSRFKGDRPKKTSELRSSPSFQGGANPQSIIQLQLLAIAAFGIVADDNIIFFNYFNAIGSKILLNLYQTKYD